MHLSRRLFTSNLSMLLRRPRWIWGCPKIMNCPRTDSTTIFSSLGLSEYFWYVSVPILISVCLENLNAPQIARKASATYYPTLHLEISRYVAIAGKAGFEMPWTVSRLVGLPPNGCCKASARPPTTPRGKSSATQKTPRTEKSTRDASSYRHGAPSLPAPKIEPIKLQ
jgi:hypothetical protein